MVTKDKTFFKTISAGILTTMITGLIINGLLIWREFAIAQNDIQNIKKEKEKFENSYEKQIDKMDTRMERMENYLSDLHWQVIESKGIKIAKRK